MTNITFTTHCLKGPHLYAIHSFKYSQALYTAGKGIEVTELLELYFFFTGIEFLKTCHNPNYWLTKPKIETFEKIHTRK